MHYSTVIISRVHPYMVVCVKHIHLFHAELFPRLCKCSCMWGITYSLIQSLCAINYIIWCDYALFPISHHIRTRSTVTKSPPGYNIRGIHCSGNESRLVDCPHYHGGMCSGAVALECNNVSTHGKQGWSEAHVRIRFSTELRLMTEVLYRIMYCVSSTICYIISTCMNIKKCVTIKFLGLCQLL